MCSVEFGFIKAVVTIPGAWGCDMVRNSQNRRGLFMKPMTKKTVGTENECSLPHDPRLLFLPWRCSMLLILCSVVVVVVFVTFTYKK